MRKDYFMKKTLFSLWMACLFMTACTSNSNSSMTSEKMNRSDSSSMKSDYVHESRVSKTKESQESNLPASTDLNSSNFNSESSSKKNEESKETTIPYETYLDFELQEDDTYGVRMKKGASAPQHVIIPATHEGKTVTTVLRNAFYKQEKLIRVDLPNTIRSLEYGAFSATSLKEIVLPETLVKIDSYCFSGCLSLTSVTFPSSLKEIDSSAFAHCIKMVSISLPEGLEKIEGSAFDSCGLTEVILPSTVKEIGESAFWSCENLTKIDFPDSLLVVGRRCFYNTKVPMKEVDGLRYYGTEDNPYLILSECIDIKKQTTAVIHEKAKIIAEHAFDSLSKTSTDRSQGIYTVETSAKIRSIGAYAFHYCNNLRSIPLTDSLKYIGERCFESCVKLTEINLTDSIEFIDVVAFGGAAITSIYWPKSLSKIPFATFSTCRKLTSFPIPETVTEIGIAAFETCESLTSIEIPNSVNRIDSYAFQNTLKGSVFIPANVQTMELWAFRDNKNLTDIYCEAKSKPDGWDERWNGNDESVNVHWGAKKSDIR